jgi:predicted dehydrogenase
VTTRIAILGTGSIGTRHLRVFAGLPGVEVVAISLRGAERAAQLVAEGYRVADSLRAALPCDGVVIATDTGRHIADLRHALAADIPFALVEKPLAPGEPSTDELAPILSSQRVFVACCLRFQPALLAFRQKLPDLGAVHSVTIQCRSYLPDWRPQRDYRQTYSARPDEGGVLRDLFHEVDYSLWLFGAPWAVLGQLGHSGRLGIEADDQATLFWTTPSGAHVTIGLDYLSRHPLRTMTAQGEQGSLTWDGVRQTVQFHPRGGAAETSELAVPRDAIYQAQARAFVAAIQGEPSWPLPGAAESCFGLAVCDSLRRSHRTGRLERVAARQAA